MTGFCEGGREYKRGKSSPPSRRMEKREGGREGTSRR